MSDYRPVLYDELIAGPGGYTGTVGSKRDKSNPRCSPLVKTRLESIKVTTVSSWKCSFYFGHS